MFIMLIVNVMLFVNSVCHSRCAQDGTYVTNPCTRYLLNSSRTRASTTC